MALLHIAYERLLTGIRNKDTIEQYGIAACSSAASTSSLATSFEKPLYLLLNDPRRNLEPVKDSH